MRWLAARRRGPQGGKPEHHAPIPAVLNRVRFAGRLRNSACQITHSHHAFASIVVHLDHENACAADHAAHKQPPPMPWRRNRLEPHTLQVGAF